MIALVQRLARVQVTVGGQGAGEIIGKIGPGLLVFVCAEPNVNDGPVTIPIRLVA